MKKFLTALASFLLAGTMAFSFAACKGNGNDTDNNGDNTNNSGDTGNNGGNNSGNNGGNNSGNNGGNNGGNTETEVPNKALLDAINATMSADKYTLTTNSSFAYTILFNGNKMAADTVLISTPEGNFTGLDFFKMMMEDEKLTDEDFENPFSADGEESIYSFDFAGGIAKIEDKYRDESYIKYYEVDDTSINRYEMYERGTWNPDTDQWVVTEIVPEQRSYTGYASEAQAKQVFKKALLSDVDGMTLEEVTSTTVKGVGANADKEGTLIELIDLFDYDATTKTYSVTVAAATGYESAAASECDFAITVKDGKVSEMTMTLTAEQSMEDEGMPGVTMQIGVSQTSKYSDLGTLSVAVDKEYKDVKEEDISVTHVVATETLWKELLSDFATKEFSITYYTENPDMTHHYYVDTESKTALATHGESIHNKFFYRVEEDKVNQYGASLDVDNNISSLSSVKDYPISGDAVDALIAALGNDYVNDYYAGFDDGALSDLFSKFEFTWFDSLEAHLKLNGKDVTVSVSFYYDNYEEEFRVSGINIDYGVYNLGGERQYFYVDGNAKDELDYWASFLDNE